MSDTQKNIRKKPRRALRITLFLLILTCIIVLAGALFRPIWRSWNNYDTVFGYYEQPENSFEVALIGPSNVVSGLSPMELYAAYGIAAYNFGTEGQPMYCSLYWLKEAYRTQGETLRTVVLDVSALREREHKESAYHKAFDGMALSSVKLEAVSRHAGSINDTLTFLIPLFSYHDRWTDLDEDDIEKFSYEPNTSTMGYYLITEAYLESTAYDEMWLPDGELDPDDTDEDVLNDEYLEYFDEIVSFCEENGLNLILIKTPHGYWNDSYHNAVQELADNYGLEFLDMNFSPVFEEIGFNFAADTKDGAHPNYYGMQKITAYLGDYLSVNSLAGDVRGDDDYAYLAEALEGYSEYVTDTVSLKETTDLVSYLETALSNGNNVICIAAKQDAAGGLTDEVRDALSDLGFTLLSQLESDEAYLAAAEDGSVVLESSGDDLLQDTYTASDGTEIKLTSGSSVSITISGDDEASGTGGLNIVVYNTAFGCVTDAAAFATADADGLTRDGMNYAAALKREIQSGTVLEDMSEELQTLYLYNERY